MTAGAAYAHPVTSVTLEHGDLLTPQKSGRLPRGIIRRTAKGDTLAISVGDTHPVACIAIDRRLLGLSFWSGSRR